MAQWKKDKFPKLQAIMIAAERHSRWGISVIALVLAALIHFFFLFGLKIDPLPIGNWETGSALTLVDISEPAYIGVKPSDITDKTYLNVKIKGFLSPRIKFTGLNFSKIKEAENECEFKVETPEKTILQNLTGPVIFKIAFPEGKKEISIIRSSGNVDFDTSIAAFVNKLSIVTNDSKLKIEEMNSIVTIIYE